MSKISSITDIIAMRTLEKIQDNFSEATGISCLIYNVKYEPVTKFSRQSRLSLEIAKHPDIASAINRVIALNLDKCVKDGQTHIAQLYNDTYSFIVPIATDAGLIGFLVSGFTRLGNPNIVNCIKEADRLGIELDTYLEMYLELALVTKEKLEACANLFKIVTTSISHLAKEGSEAKEKIHEVLSINDILEKEVELASKELKESEERYRRIFNNVIDGIYETDMQGLIRDINPGGAKALGFTREELLGTMMCERYVNPADRNEFVRLCLRDGHVEYFHPYIRLKNGETKYFETNAVLIKDVKGKPIGIQGIFRDITPRIHTSIKPKTDNATANFTVKNT